MTHVDGARSSSNETARRRAAARELAPGLCVLVVSQVPLIVFDPDAPHGGWQLGWALTPLAGIGLLVWAQVRTLRRSDERERAVELSAMAVGYAVRISALATVGILQAAGIGDIRQQVQITTSLGVLAWVAAAQLLKRRA